MLSAVYSLPLSNIFLLLQLLILCANQSTKFLPMVNNSYAPSITTICKNMLPFSFKKRRGLPAAERRLSEIQLRNIKWQQESFHQIMKLMGLQKEGILSDAEVSEFKSHLMDTLMEVSAEQEHSSILRDKLLFLQELHFANCILEDEYHSMKSLLLHRLSVAEGLIEVPNDWAIVEFKDKTQSQISKSKSKNRSSKKQQIKGSTSVLGLVLASHQNEKAEQQSNTALAKASGSANGSGATNLECDPFWEKNEKQVETKSMLMLERSESRKKDKSGKKQWGFSGFKKWKRKSSEDETTPLPSEVKIDNVDGFVSIEAVESGKNVKRKLQPELSLEKDITESESQQPPTETKWDSVAKTSPESCKFDIDDQLEAIWANSTKWETFNEEDDENCNPNIFSHQDQDLFSLHMDQQPPQKSYDCTNPFAENYDTKSTTKPLVSESISFDQYTNPFWTRMNS